MRYLPYLNLKAFVPSTSDGKGYLAKRCTPLEGLEQEWLNQFADIYSLGCVFLGILPAPGSMSGRFQLILRFTNSMSIIRQHLILMNLDASMESVSDTIVSMTEAYRGDSSTAAKVSKQFARKT